MQYRAENVIECMISVVHPYILAIVISNVDWNVKKKSEPYKANPKAEYAQRRVCFVNIQVIFIFEVLFIV